MGISRVTNMGCRVINLLRPSDPPSVGDYKGYLGGLGNHKPNPYGFS